MTELTYLDDPMLTEEREKKSIGSGEGEGDSEAKADGEGEEIEVVAETPFLKKGCVITKSGDATTITASEGGTVLQATRDYDGLFFVDFCF